ncbi:type II secretion system F family protein [Acetanaerobacterium elongatum]|uniref:Type II secretion system protein F (GspF) n=1 Tax=Acetanaerobacterium elongatum TaxID=258515 RepID=A0A1G9V440_9FIRM|nr:type II secretion system F family protein [Acetanaerobacterium elongatum]SDM66928.1 type II secretion system protein F (GspF) [Acetanaerobacterium elongatum]
MPTYKYEAQAAGGGLIHGFAEADNPNDLFSKLRQRGEYCVTYSEAKVSKAIATDAKASGKLSTRELALFCRQFSTMLNAGLTVIKCLDTLYRQAVKKKTKLAVMGVYEGVQKGLTLSTAMKLQKNFPSMLVNMVESGEMSGSLDTIMSRMAEHFEKEHRLHSKVINALIYPIILIIVGIGAILVLLGFVIPQFFTMFESMGAELPGITKFLLAVSTFVRDRWYLIILFIGLIIGLFYAVCHTKSGRVALASFVLHVPIFGKLKKTIITARFSRSLATLFASGMSLISALEISTRVVNNAKLDEYMVDVIEKVRKGSTLSSVIEQVNIFPPMFSSMVSIGEESGALDDILYKTAAFYDDEADAAISIMVASIEPIMIVVLGLFVGFIILSVIMPMMSIYQNIAAA